MADGGLRNRQKQLVSSSGGVLTPPSIDSTDIVVEILSWLPGNTLVQFRRVCKLWRTIISDSNFVRKQLSRSINDNNFRLMFFKGRRNLHSIDYESLSSLFVRNENISSIVDASCRTHNLRRSFQSQIRRVYIIGSCNGLVCLVINREDVFIWNPCTGLTNVLPKPPEQFLRPCFNGFGPCFYGFGYDSVTDDYKVILGQNENASRTSKVVVFTLKTGSWRTVEGLINGADQLEKRGLLLNGALHWLNNWRLSSESRIISFNLAEEKFQELVPLSNIINGRKKMKASIGAYRGSHLFCSLRHNTSMTMEIWVMMEYGVKESWTNSILMQINDDHIRPNYLYVIEDDKVLMSFIRGDLKLYDPKGQKTYRITLENRNDVLVELAMYIETLVSPVTGK